jgi:acyl-CoA synthetase (AMP-forming)/AMP-acid ligase II
VNLFDTLAIPAELMPDAPSLHDAAGSLTYAELGARTADTAAGLRERGVGPGMTVATMGGFTSDFVALFYATLAVGARIAPLNARMKADELRIVLERLAPDLLVVDDRYAEVAAEALAGIDAAPPILPAGEPRGAGEWPLEPAEVDPEADAILLHTSGTTGVPKPVRLSHLGLMSTILRIANPPDGTPRGATVLAAPNHHVAGLSGLLNSVFSGRRIELLPRFTAADWLDRVESSGADHAFVVPTMLHRILDDPAFDAGRLGSLRVLAYGAAPMPGRVIREALERFPAGCGFIGSYGQTETGGTVCVLGVEDHELARAGDAVGLARLSSIGKPLEGTELTIVDEAGEPVGTDVDGEIAVRFDADEPWRATGDLGRIDADGYVFLSSRRDDLIIRGGENIDPAEVEAVLDSHPAVGEVAVVGLPDDEWGQIVAAFVVPRGDAEPEPADLIAHSKASLASYKAPSEVEIVTALPRTALGKVRRRDLVATRTLDS